MKDKISPTLLEVVSPDVLSFFLKRSYKSYITLSSNQILLNKLCHDLIKAYNLQKIKPHLKDKALRLMIRNIAHYISTVNNIPLNIRRNQIKEYEMVLFELEKVLKKKKVDDKSFLIAVYLEILPIILSVNHITSRFLNSSSYNSRIQVLSTMQSFIESYYLRERKGKFFILAPSCSHYDTKLENEENAYDRGLLSEFYVPQIQKVLEPIKKISNILARYNISVEIIIPQIDPISDSRLTFAMVPAAIWKHIEDHNVAEMLIKAHKLAQEFHSIAKSYLNKKNSINYLSHSLSDLKTNNISTIDLAMNLNKQIEQAYFIYKSIINPSDNKLTSWTELSYENVKTFVDYLSFREPFLEVTRLTAKYFSWDIKEKNRFGLVYESLAIPDWGGLDDTKRFYFRESLRRTNKKIAEWKRTFNRENEFYKLLSNNFFFPNRKEKMRKVFANRILKKVEVLSNIGIGGRGIFNTTIYFALGNQLSDLNKKSNVAIMWPIQETTDRQALDAMNKGYKFTSDGKHEVIPLITPDKSRLQPFGKRQ